MAVPEPISVSDLIEKLNTAFLRYETRIVGEVTSTNKNYGWGVPFCIKDTKENALLNSLIWMRDYTRSGIDLQDGMEVIITGRPEIYAPNGKLSFKATTIELAGEGKLKQEYEKLKKRLTDEGLFALEKKRPLPLFPKHIGIITSRAGVVMQDFSSNIGLHGFQILNVDSRVEGKDAIHDLHAAIQTLRSKKLDVLVIIRGGGSLESLQAFNNESLVREIASFPCPVITGIGHDTDVTLAQLAADFGASTPTAVAKKLNEPWVKAIGDLNRIEVQIISSYKANVEKVKNRIERFDSFINTQFTRIERQITGIRKDIESCLSSLKIQIRTKGKDIETLTQQLITEFSKWVAQTPEGLQNSTEAVILGQGRLVTMSNQILNEAGEDIVRAFQPQLISSRNLLSANTQIISARDPAKNLALGYSLNYAAGKLLRSTKGLAAGQLIETRLADGAFTSEVKDIT